MGARNADWASEPIAIVGLSCKFAGEASNPSKLWTMLSEGRSAWSEIPADRFNTKGVYHPDHEKAGTIHVKGAHFIQEDPGLFDAAFFSYSAETASTLDPQFRLQLESVYEALENAGLPLSQVAGSKTSVFAGIFAHDYREAIVQDEANLPRFLQTGTGSAFASNRISHFFDLRGASVTVDTGCSTTLVALHQAVQSLRLGEADMSIVGGSNLLLTPGMFMGLGSVNFLSPDGKSYAFDSRANGYGRGEGVATLVVKRLSDAIAAGDPIRAVIRETGLNQDGKSETITSPSQPAQEALMRETYRRAGLDPRDTQYFEAHGTGTKMGDPTEARAVASVFREGREEDQALRIGSIKTSIGHTETTSGLAAVIKVVMAMERGVIPPTANFEEPNPELSLEDWRLKVVTEPEEWPQAPGGVRRASINNFGYGGTNSHVILEDGRSWTRPANGANGIDGHVEPASGDVLEEEGDQTRLLILSGRDEQACQQMVVNLKGYLEHYEGSVGESETLLESLAYTLGERRTVFPWVAVHPVQVSHGMEKVVDMLGSPAFRTTRTSRRPRVGLVFTGQGAQWHAMGRELITAYPVFKASLDEAGEALHELGAEWSLLEELSRDATTTRVNDTAFSIPVCVALQISLVRLLRSWGVEPAAVTSHSSGEVAAAYTVGALSLPRAMAVAYYRATMAADKKLRGPVRGAMVAVGLGNDEAEDLLAQIDEDAHGKAVVACVNSPSSVTIAGDATAIQEVEALAKADGVFARLLRVDTGYHSHHMEPVAEPYLEALRALPDDEQDDKLDSIAFSSAVTGDRIDDVEELADPKHWIGSLLQAVQFVDAFGDMVLGDLDPSGASIDVVVEVGPHTALGGPIKEIMAQPEYEGLEIPYYGCLVRNKDACESMQSLAANLIREGLELNMGAINFPRGKPSAAGVLTDLPSYSWNHSHRHWIEPRFAHAIRTRDQRPHDLLGLLIPGTNREAPTWRNMVRVDQLPWLRDHVIQGNILYPGAGFVCLAIEATRQKVGGLDKNTREISGYRLRDVDLLQALVVPDNPGEIEVQTCITPAGEKIMSNKGWMRFTVSSVTADNRWTQHAQGLITAEFSTPNSPDDDANQAVRAMKTGTVSKGYTRHFDPDDMFATLRALGINHGPKFRNITEIVQAGRLPHSSARMTVPDTTVPNDLPRSHVVHPATLDSVVTAVYSALPSVGAREDSAKVPRSIERLWVSSRIGHEPSQELRSFSALTHNDSQGLQADVCVVRSDDGAGSESKGLPLITMDNFRFRSLGRGAVGNDAKPWERDMYSKIEWAPDLSLGLPATCKAVEKNVAPPREENGQLLLDLRRACFYFVQDVLAALTPDDIAQLRPHHVQFHGWMQRQVQLASEGRLAPDSASWPSKDTCERQPLVSLVGAQCIEGELICRLGPQLLSILRRESNPLDLMNEGELLDRYRRHALGDVRYQDQLAAVLRAVAHKNPRARVLEIGAGPATARLLRALDTRDEGGPLIESWHFTNSTSSGFDAARAELAAWGDVLDFSRLNIEQEPASQGFQLGSYDVVVACDTLPAAESLESNLTHVRSLLKPGGKFLMAGRTQDQLEARFVFGLLPDGQRLRSLPVSSWAEALEDAGFSGVDVSVRDYESDVMHSVSTIMATAAPDESQLASHKLVIVTGEKAPPPPEWLDELQAAITAITKGPPIAVQALGEASADLYADSICIFVGELGRPLLHDLDASGFDNVKAMATSSKGLMWLTRGGAVDYEAPEMSLAAGFLRSLRNEYIGRRLVTLDLDPRAPSWDVESVPLISHILKTSFGTATKGKDVPDTPEEFEYAIRDGVVLVPRLFRDAERNRAAGAEAPETEAADIPAEPFSQPGRPLRLQAGVPGLLDTLAFVDDEWAAAHLSGPLPPELVEIEPAAYGVNFRDVMVAMGQLRERIMGIECAGTITRVGTEAASQGFAVGDRVMAQLLGPLSSRARVSWHGVVRMPSSDMSFEDAASIPVIFVTAYMALVEIAQLEPGQSVLVHAAAGGVGQAAIMLAKHLGAEVYATVGSPEKRELIVSTYGIPEDHIFSSRDASFEPGIRAATGGRGVDFVLNSLAGPLLQASFNIVARFGHFVEIGKRDLEGNSALEMEPFSRHVSFSAIDLIQLLQYRGRRLQRMLREVAHLFEQGAVSPIRPVTSYPIADAAQAFRLVQTGKHTGKVVLSIKPGDAVPVLPQRSRVQLAPDASYLIVGGLGGLGRSVAHWMVDRGAKHLILLSRSAGDAGKTAMVEELEDAGCHVMAVSCDVTNSYDLDKALRGCKDNGMPVVRGVIQAAVVFHDSVLEHMTMEHWQASLPPKVAGTWNLHNQFSQPDSLDFFVILSSILAVMGLASQTNYTAGGAYEDALAHWRVAHGLPAVSLDLGGIKGVGHVQETAGVAARLLQGGHRLLSEDQVLEAVESAILRPTVPQVVTAVNSGPGHHWDCDGESPMGRDARFLALKYRQVRGQAGAGSDSAASSLASKLAGAASQEDAVSLVGEAVTAKLAGIFMIPAADVDLGKPPSHYGVDSLVAVELRNMLVLQAAAEVSIFNILQSASLAALAVEVVEKSAHVQLAT